MSTAMQWNSHDDLYPTRLRTEQWLERRDPTFWGRWTPQAPLTREQTESFDENGYLVLKDVFSPLEVTALQEESRRMRSGEATLSAENVITEPGSSEVRTVFRLDEQNALFDRLARDARIAGRVSYLLDDDVYLHQSRLNYKPGFTGKEFYWHSDFETWHAEDGMPRMRAISASILLTDNDALNGPLMLMPGSHNTFVACAGETPEDNHKTSLKKQEVGVPSHDSLSEMARRHGIDYAAGVAGTVVLFDCNTLHGSNGNITPFPRSNAFFVYNAWSNKVVDPFAARSPRPAFLSSRDPERPIEIVSGKLA
ncbi:ectoine hydroxylase [Aurantimonas endophytica]|uniref:Ectoine hydroxylase n=1 Tax=Aurantimonas endophytica TaxID=1522175 RepID=A0A7W6HG72_9HYPH|nr:ectoine hydroxylase [Aurantimonas endophytica]MBB4004568.1 ectoine hydroxylase [Aurantimonas endophytica]MCO6405404.1 ectoine hydroxylase [Aurantimonas endophytica]